MTDLTQEQVAQRLLQFKQALREQLAAEGRGDKNSDSYFKIVGRKNAALHGISFEQREVFASAEQEVRKQVAEVQGFKAPEQLQR